MSFFALFTGTLIADPISRERDGGKDPFTTVNIRVETGADAILISVVAIGDRGKELLDFSKGDPISVSGRARLTTWTGRDGTERHGVSVTIGEMIGIRPKRRRAASAPRARARQSSFLSPLLQDRVDDLWNGGTP